MTLHFILSERAANLYSEHLPGTNIDPTNRSKTDEGDTRLSVPFISSYSSRRVMTSQASCLAHLEIMRHDDRQLCRIVRSIRLRRKICISAGKMAVVDSAAIETTDRPSSKTGTTHQVLQPNLINWQTAAADRSTLFISSFILRIQFHYDWAPAW